MKVISAHQPAYIPWLGYFHKIMLCDEFVIMDDVQFEKNSFINRNRILSNNGTEVMLTIPVASKDYVGKKINEIEVANFHWKAKHLKTIEYSYKKCEYFGEVFPMIESALSIDSRYLVDYTNGIFFCILNYLAIKTPISFASALQIQSKKLDYVIEVTKKKNGNAFLFGALGKKYADNHMLEMNGVIPFFQEYIHPEYDQSRLKFIPYLSVIDLMMRQGKSALTTILKGNLVKESLYL